MTLDPNFKLYQKALKRTFQWATPDLALSDDDLEAATSATDAALSKGIESGLNAAVSAVKPALNDAMAQSVWGWPNVTVRKNTSDVDAPRDIIDTANLRDSMDATVNAAGELEIVYTAPYANIVHYGGITRPYGRGGDTFVYPARPWISSMFEGSNGIDKFAFVEIVQQEVEDSLGS